MFGYITIQIQKFRRRLFEAEVIRDLGGTRCQPDHYVHLGAQNPITEHVADGALPQQFDQRTGIGVTSAIAWSPDATQFIYGTYEGTAVVAHTPAP
jgi:hypothetical protein